MVLKSNRSAGTHCSRGVNQNRTLFGGNDCRHFHYKAALHGELKKLLKKALSYPIEEGHSVTL